MSQENVPKVVSVLCVALTPSKGTTNWGQLTHSTVQLHRGVPLNFPAVTCRTFPLRT